MRRVSLVLNSIVVVFFIFFLAYTHFARQHLESLGREFVTEKTLEYSRPVVKVADEALDSPLLKMVLSDEQKTTIRNEIAEYRNDPTSYISDLTRQKIRDAPSAKADPLVEKVASIKKTIRTYYDKTLNALTTDLRIFSLSNLFAGLIGFVLACKSTSKIRKPIVWFSFLMFVAVLYCSFLYVDDLTFFRILFRTHMGWWYAVFLFVTTVALYLDFGHHANVAEENDAHGTADSAGSSEQATVAAR